MPTTASSERVRFKHVLPIPLPPPLSSGGAGNVLSPPTRFKHVLPPAGGVGEEKEGEEKDKEGEEKDAVSNDRGFYKRGGSGKGGLPSKFNSKPKPKAASPPRLPGKIPIPAPPVKIPTRPKAPKIPTLPKPKSNPIPPKHFPPLPPFRPNPPPPPPPPPPFHPNPPPPTNHVPFGHHNSPPPHTSQCIHPRGIDRLRCYEPDAIIGTLLVIVALLALPFVVWRGMRMFGRRRRGRGQGGGDEERGESLEMGRRGEGAKEGDVELGRLGGGEGERGCDGVLGRGMGRQGGGDGRREVEVGDERCCVGRRGAGMENEDGGTVGMVGCEDGGEGVDCGNGEAFGREISRERGGEWGGCEAGETEMEKGASEDELDREPSRGRRRDRGRSLPKGQLGEQLGFGKKREDSVLSEGMVRTALVGFKVVGGEGVGVVDLGGEGRDGEVRDGEVRDGEVSL